MKHSSGLLELIFTVVFLMAGTNMLLALVLLCNSTEYHYISDKTVYSASDSIEIKPLVSIDYGGAMLLPVLQDDYTPAMGRNTEYSFTDNPYDDSIVTPAYSFKVGEGWKGNRVQTFSSGVNTLNTKSNVTSYADKQMYLVWNQDTDSWTITSVPVNIYDVSED